MIFFRSGTVWREGQRSLIEINNNIEVGSFSVSTWAEGTATLRLYFWHKWLAIVTAHYVG